MNLDKLPDDALLLVLGFLRTRELLRCRGVCRRFRDMALHPHLWRKRSVYSFDGVQLCAAVLRLAPCLGTLDVCTEFKNVQHLMLGPLFVSTNCAISELRAYIDSRGAVFLAMALSRQVALGRLTSLSLSVSETTGMTRELLLLLDHVRHTPGLTSLALTARTNEAVPLKLSLPKAARGDVVPASLRRLEWDCKDSTLPLYLKWHADTLEEVHLNLSEVPAGTAALLGSLPRLREVKCSMMEDMPALLQCPALKSLELAVDVKQATRAFLPGAHKFLSQAAGRLETVTLQYVEEDELPTKTKVCAGAVNLLLSLAGPGGRAASALRSLSLIYSGCADDAWEPQPQLLPLACILPRLEHLVTLNLGGPHTPHFLEALDGHVLPRLEWLRIYIRDNAERGCCAHEWAHGAEPRNLLRRYPRLHLEVDPRHGGCENCDFEGCEDCKCNYCAKNSCHDFNLNVHTLFTHPEREVCNRKHVEVNLRIEL